MELMNMINNQSCNKGNCKNMTSRVKRLRKSFLTEIKNYKRKYTIYMLVCNITGDTYYGSTCMTLKDRMRDHKSKSSRCSSKIIINRGNYLPLIPLETNLSYGKKIEREDYCINSNVCVNDMCAKLNVEKTKETHKKYYEINKEERLKYGANWKKNNKERIKKTAANYRKDNKEHIIQSDYWRRKYHLGILARSYFN